MARRGLFDDFEPPCDADAWVSLPTPFTVASAIPALKSLVWQLEQLQVDGHGRERIQLRFDRAKRILRVDRVDET